jgi:hypothetical protein
VPICDFHMTAEWLKWRISCKEKRSEDLEDLQANGVSFVIAAENATVDKYLWVVGAFWFGEITAEQNDCRSSR